MDQTKTIILACVLGILCLGSTTPMYGCKCAEYPLAERFISSRFIFSATVQYRGNKCIDNIMEANYEYLPHRYYQYIVLKVTKVWKGNLPENILIIQPYTSCYYGFSKNVEYVVFASQYKISNDCDSNLKNIVVLTTSQCRGNRGRDEILSASLDSLSCLSSIMYEVQTTNSPAEYRTILFSPEHGVTLNNRTISQTGIFNLYGQRIPILPNLDSKAIRMEVNKILLSNSWYLLRYHTDAGVFILPFIYYEDRFYNADKQMTWK